MKDLEIEGAIFGAKYPRIVRVNSFYLEAVPEGYILILQNKDVPGVVGAVGTILGKHGINIAGMELGRSEKGGNAISFTHVDEVVSKRLWMNSWHCRKSSRPNWSNSKRRQ